MFFYLFFLFSRQTQEGFAVLCNRDTITNMLRPLLDLRLIKPRRPDDARIVLRHKVTVGNPLQHGGLEGRDMSVFEAGHRSGFARPPSGRGHPRASSTFFFEGRFGGNATRIVL